MAQASLPPERVGIAPPTDLAVRRAGLSAAVAAGLWRTDPAPEELVINGVRCLRFTCPLPARGTLLHLHGGAFRIGCPEQMGPFAAALAAACAVNVICPAYRLAPEHPFPAGLSDGWAVLQALVKSGAAPLLVSGDSAGGGLAAGLAALSQQAGIALAGLALLSPWLDLTITHASFQTNAATDPLFSEDAAQEAAILYLQGIPADDPLASPLKGDVTDFPPTYLNVGTGEVLLDDALVLYARLQACVVPTTLHRVEGMEHVAVTRDPNLTGSAESFEALTSFISGILNAT